MNLFRETQAFLVWIARLADVFLRKRPWTTIALIGALATNRVTSILAFVLPMKAIGLIARHPESGRLQSLIGADHSAMVVILLTGVILCFIASIVSDLVARRLSSSGGLAIFGVANKLAVVRNHRSTAQSIYHQFASVTSGILFVGFGFAVIAYFVPALIVALAGALLLEFVFTASVLGRADALQPRGLARFIFENTRNYLSTLSSLNILIALGVLIYPFIWGNGANIVNVLISFLILRRILGVAVGCVAESIRLFKRREVAGAIFFPTYKYMPDEGNDIKSLRDVFSRQAREDKAEKELRAAGINFDNLTVHWIDSSLPGVNMLALRLFCDDAKVACYQQQVYLPKQDSRLKNEIVLFEHMSREMLAAPDVVSRFNEGPFRCQICDTRFGVPANTNGILWPGTVFDVTLKQLSAAPPEGLVRAYAMSHPLMAERLSDALVERLDAAADTAEDAAQLELLRRSMPGIRARIRQAPLYVYNPEIKPPNVFIGQDGEAFVMTWGRWALEPVGYGIPYLQESENLEELARAVVHARPELGKKFSGEDIEWFRRVGVFESQLKKNHLKAALSQVGNIIAEDTGDVVSSATECSTLTAADSA